MKKFISLLSLIVLLSISLTSCSSDTDSADQNKLVVKIIDVASNGDTKTTLFNYNGYQIINIVGEDQETEFTYTNDLITKIIDIDLATSHQNTLDYTYANDELVKIVSSDNYIMNFVHNQDSTISYEKKTVDGNGNQVLVYHGTLFFQNNNLTKDERTMDDTPATVLSKKKVTYEYDAKNNPFHNIVGFAKLLNYFGNISSNNAVNGTKEASTAYLDTEQYVSSIVNYNNVYHYDSDNYPTEIVSPTPVFGNGIINHEKSMLFY